MQVTSYYRYTDEELVELIGQGDEAAYEQLFNNLRPIILHEASMYTGKLDLYDMDDFLQEGRIVAWEIISRGNFKGGKFSTYFGAAIRYRLCKIFRDYTLKNLVCIDEHEDLYGNITRTLVESDYAKNYRRKKADQHKRWLEKKKASAPPKEKKPPMTKQERSQRNMVYQKKYFAEHPEKLEERREKNRIRERERRARIKAERIIGQAII